MIHLIKIPIFFGATDRKNLINKIFVCCCRNNVNIRYIKNNNILVVFTHYYNWRESKSKKNEVCKKYTHKKNMSHAHHQSKTDVHQSVNVLYVNVG